MKKRLQLGITGLILGFMAWSLYKNLQQLQIYPLEINYYLLILSTLCIIVISFGSAILWGIILTSFNISPAWSQVIDIWMKSLLAKYLPGGIWNLMGRVYLCQQAQISHSATLGSMALELLLALLAQIILVSLLGSVYFGQMFSWALYAFLAGLLFSLGIIIYPPIFHKLFQFLLRKEPHLVLPQFSTLQLCYWLFLYVSLYILGGFTFFLFITAFYPLNWSQLPAIIALVNFAFVVSLLTPLAPNGLGVREGLLATLLSYFMPSPIAVIIAISTRGWLMVGEFITVGLSQLGGYLLQNKRQIS